MHSTDLKAPSADATRALRPLLFVSFLASLSFSIVMPFLVFIVDDLGGNAFVLGLLGAAFSAFQLLGSPWLGALSDRIGRKRVLLFSQLGAALAWLVFLAALWAPARPFLRIEHALIGSFALNLPLLLILLSRSTDGLMNGSISVANALVADMTTGDERKRGFGKMGAATSLGFVVGPLLAGLAAHGLQGIRLLVIVAFLLSALGALVVRVGLQDYRPSGESRRAVARTPTLHAQKVLGGGPKDCRPGRPLLHRRSFNEVLRIPGMPAMLWLYFLIYLGFSFFYVAFPVHALRVLRWTSDRLGLFYSLLSLVLIVVQSALLPLASRKFGDVTLSLFGNLLLAVSFCLLALPSSQAAFAAALLFGLGNGLMWPSYLSMLSRIGSLELQGSVQGVASSGGSLASILGLLLGGSLYQSIGAWVFVVAASILGLVALLFLRMFTRQRPLTA